MSEQTIMYVWIIASFCLSLILGIMLILAFRRIRRLETEIRRMVAELSKLE